MKLKTVVILFATAAICLTVIAALAARFYCRTHAGSKLCVRMCPYLSPCDALPNAISCCSPPPCDPNNICFPTVREPADTSVNDSTIGYVPGETDSHGRDVSVPTGPGSFDVSKGIVAIADPVHLRVIVDQLQRKMPTHVITIQATFPPARVRLKDKRLLIQQYEAPSDNDLVCEDVTTSKQDPCENLASPNMDASKREKLRSVQYDVLSRVPASPSTIKDKDRLAGWEYLGEDDAQDDYYLVQYRRISPQPGSDLHFRKYSPSGSLLGESPPLPDINYVRIRDRARVDDTGTCYWLSVTDGSTASAVLHVWSPR